MLYCDNPDDKEPIFRLYDPIGFDKNQPQAGYVDGNAFARELAYLSGEKESICIYINCEGGNIKDGWSIWAAMLQSECPIDVKVVGVAYSMAAVLTLAGRKRTALSTASLMYHMGYNPDGTEDKGLNVLNKSMITGIAERWGKSEDEVKKILTAETWYTAKEAQGVGILDEVHDVSTLNAPKDPKDKKAQKVFALAYLNKALQKEPEMEKKEICAKLGLDPNVSDAVAFAALDAFIAKANKAVAKADAGDDDEDEKKMKAKLAKAEEDAATAKAELAKFKADQDAAATAKAEEDKVAVAQAKAKTEIEAKATERGLKFEASTIANYVAMAGLTEEGLTRVITTIEAIPVTKKAASMAVAVKTTTAEAKFETDSTGGVVNTDSYAAHLNQRAMKNAQKRFTPSENN